MATQKGIVQHHYQPWQAPSGSQFGRSVKTRWISALAGPTPGTDRHNASSWNILYKIWYFLLVCCGVAAGARSIPILSCLIGDVGRARPRLAVRRELAAPVWQLLACCPAGQISGRGDGEWGGGEGTGQKLNMPRCGQSFEEKAVNPRPVRLGLVAKCIYLSSAAFKCCYNVLCHDVVMRLS